MTRGVAAILTALLTALVLAACGGSDDPEPGSKEGGKDRGKSGGQGAKIALGFNDAVTPEIEGLDQLTQIGAEFVRVPINWSAAEPTEGQELDWTVADRANDTLEAAGLKPLWTVTSSPCWAAEDEDNCEDFSPSYAPSAGKGVEAYGSFVAEVAERYPDAFGIQIWNEPNTPKFWIPTPDAERYREIAVAAADAVDATGSKVPLVLGGPSPVTAEEAAEKPEKIEQNEFLTEVLSGDDRPDVDAATLHPYSLLIEDADPIDASIELFESGADAIEAAAPGLEVWVSEVGLTTAGKNSVSAEEQASGLAELIEVFSARTDVITIHRIFDQADPPFPFEAGFGVIESDGVTQKPAFCAVGEAVGSPCGG